MRTRTYIIGSARDKEYLHSKMQRNNEPIDAIAGVVESAVRQSLTELSAGSQMIQPSVVPRSGIYIRSINSVIVRITNVFLYIPVCCLCHKEAGNCSILIS